MPDYQKMIEERKAKRLLVMLNLGAGEHSISGSINIDLYPRAGCVKDDITVLADFPQQAADSIFLFHVIEHLWPDQVLKALIRWRAILKPGGKIWIETPDLSRCIATIGKETGANGLDLAMQGLYGTPAIIRKEGMGQVHKWLYSQETLSELMTKAGFINIERRPVKQTFREAHRIDRDMALEGERPNGT